MAKRPPPITQPSKALMDQTTQTGHSDKNPCTEKEGYYQYVNGGGSEVMLDEEFVDTVANCVSGKRCPCSSSIRY